MLESNYVFK